MTSILLLTMLWVRMMTWHQVRFLIITVTLDASPQFSWISNSELSALGRWRLMLLPLKLLWQIRIFLGFHSVSWLRKWKAV